MTKREERRATLTRKLLEAATARIVRHGLNGLRVRDVTNDAGCGLGTIYQCYSDLDNLVTHVNSGTLASMRHAMNEAVEKKSEPVEELKALASAYLGFARNNRNLWKALFEHHLPDDAGLPEWHLSEIADLLGYIARPVAKLEPNLDTRGLEARTRTYFAAVHGIVSIRLQERFVSLSGETLRCELDFLIERLAKG